VWVTKCAERVTTHALLGKPRGRGRAVDGNVAHADDGTVAPRAAVDDVRQFILLGRVKEVAIVAAFEDVETTATVERVRAADAGRARPRRRGGECASRALLSKGWIVPRH
jgi:hypothetical protein